MSSVPIANIAKLLLLALSCHLILAQNLRNLVDPATTVKKEHDENRPVIYTFFEMKLRRDGILDLNGEHDKMLATWSNAWSEAGWDPRILTLEDAKKHPEFEKYSAPIMEITDPTAFIYGNSYNYMCLMRWLAMAAQNKDGWMSDYDTFPLSVKAKDGLDLPHKGRFTVYARYVPCLMSGSAKEWNRMAKSVIERVLQHMEEKGNHLTYSDMYALEDIYHKSSNAYISEQRVQPRYPYLENDKINCEDLEFRYAFHLSHASATNAKKAGIFPKDFHEQSRHKYVKKIIRDWKEQCNPATK